ncbi:hypothetical protein GWI33_018728 [Rhynchophorus ferrugineus]|uniref:Uncharacterized protein n=1 Tax=Rhynchophorus ferrugineus TaxID=354439 RepID=A0A834I6T0_RHYFE|nr:hypothetical protein GWI33_018728 [Rhynchophorus ferrugineus]
MPCDIEKARDKMFYEPTDITIATKPLITHYWKAIKFITPNLGELKQIYQHLEGNTTKELTYNLDNIVIKALSNRKENRYPEYDQPEETCMSVGFAAAVTALYSQSPVPSKIFSRDHVSWKQKANYVTL